MDVLNISADWDQHEPVRERLRSGYNLLHPQSASDDVATVVRNKELLKPLVERMAQHADKPHPNIDALREEVAKMYCLHKRSPMPDFKDLQHEAWRLRHLLSFTKAKARRKEVSTDTFLHSAHVVTRIWLVVGSCL